MKFLEIIKKKNYFFLKVILVLQIKLAPKLQIQQLISPCHSTPVVSVVGRQNSLKTELTSMGKLLTAN